VPGPILEFGEFSLDCDRFQLRRGSRVLKLERKPMELLIFLATREGDIVTRSEIARCLWGNEVFVDTEHGINTAIRKVRQALRDDPEQPRYVQTVTGRGYRFVGPVITTQPASASDTLQAATQTETLGPKPTASSPEPSAAASPPRLLRRRLGFVLGSVTALVLITVTVMLRVRGHRIHAATLNIQSLAVLPLNNLSGDPKQDYFADGMTDELTTMLAKDSTLRVISRTSAMQFKDPHQPLREVASTLGVDGIVEGSISRADGKVHMTVQLIHAPTDTHLWADSYDRDNNDVAALPEEAALAIAKRLNASEAALKPARYVNPEAHDAYLRGRVLWIAGEYDKSGEYFQKAIELQPDYALGWSGLADHYAGGAMAGQLDPRTAIPAMVAAARKAIALDDTVPQTHLSFAAIYWADRWDLPQALQEIQRAIEIDPEYAEAYFQRAYTLSDLNRPSEAIEAAKKSMELDPLAQPWGMPMIYSYTRQYDRAITDATQRLESTPNDYGLHKMLADSYHCTGRNKESAEMVVKMFSLIAMPEFAETLKHSFEQGGYDAVIRSEIHLMEHQPPGQYLSVVDLARLYGQLGQREKTLALLEEGYRQHSPLLLDIQNDCSFDFLHNDERYRSLIKRIGLPPAW
jgi:TolB-like protein/DNA-binding winged helix-turn-helix (wHTH) protein